MTNRIALCIGAALFATCTGVGARAAPAAVATVSAIRAQYVPCPPYDAPAPTVMHRAHPRPRPLLARSLVNHTVRAKPRVSVSTRPHPIHLKPRPAAFQAPAFLAAAAEGPGRCQVLQRGPGGYGPQLMSYLPAGAPDLPVGGDANTAPADRASTAGSAAPEADSPGVADLRNNNGPFIPLSPFGSPGPLGDTGPGGLVPSAASPPVTDTPLPPSETLLSDVPEPGTWTLLIGGLFVVGYALRRRRAAVTPRERSCSR